jgi:hypothetical protein
LRPFVTLLQDGSSTNKPETAKEQLEERGGLVSGINFDYGIRAYHFHFSTFDNGLTIHSNTDQLACGNLGHTTRSSKAELLTVLWVLLTLSSGDCTIYHWERIRYMGVIRNPIL